MAEGMEALMADEDAVEDHILLTIAGAIQSVGGEYPDLRSNSLSDRLAALVLQALHEHGYSIRETS